MNPRVSKLRVGGLARLSSVDWPGELAATVFCQGCAWDCPYCHNQSLRSMKAEVAFPWDSVVRFLSSRCGLLDAVVFSGGEPTLQAALPDAIKQVREMGFRIGLHTAGMAPERFAAVLPMLDWVGFDVKAPFAAYTRVTGVEHSGEKAFESLRSLLSSGVAYEVRTTVHPALLSAADLKELEAQLHGLGVRNFVIQQFRSQGAPEGRLPAAAHLVLPEHYGSGFAHFQIR